MGIASTSPPVKELVDQVDPKGTKNRCRNETTGKEARLQIFVQENTLAAVADAQKRQHRSTKKEVE